MNIPPVSGQKTFADILALAIETETRARDLYEALTCMFAHVPGVAAFWTGLKEDEQHHISILRDVLEHLSSEEKRNPADKTAWTKLEETKLTISRRLDKRFLTLDDAYEFSHELEYSEINIIFKMLVIGPVSAGKTVEIIDANICDHQQKLIDFAKNFGGRAWRQTIVAQPWTGKTGC
ncbi:MAG TPA: ferritin family protein [Candidatus Ozemobacteraceae bacterium]|nr:ferritin family protein [Candidatus Ozemobacteraceae bacterium]